MFVTIPEMFHASVGLPEISWFDHKKCLHRTSMAGACLNISGTSKNLPSLFQGSWILILTFGRSLPSRELRYPILGKLQKIFKHSLGKDMLVFWRVCTPQLHQMFREIRHIWGFHTRCTALNVGCCCDSMCAKIGTSVDQNLELLGRHGRWIPEILLSQLKGKDL